jgi:NadR type nicotinamide-nucleotide adenylyltransferase
MAQSGGAANMTKTICLHGPESTGKSTMSTLLAQHYDCEIVPEYGRAYCEEHGTDTSMHDLVVIAQRHSAMIESAKARAVRGKTSQLILDTDPVMTAVWAQMMHGRQDPWFERMTVVADIYLLLDIDLPWVDDGLRVYGEPGDRRRFFELSKAELERRGLNWALITGDGEPRFEAALAAVESVAA